MNILSLSSDRILNMFLQRIQQPNWKILGKDLKLTSIRTIGSQPGLTISKLCNIWFDAAIVYSSHIT